MGSPESPSRGHLTEVGSEISRTFYAYNSAGTGYGKRTNDRRSVVLFGYTYNAAFALESQTYPGGRKVFAEFDDAGRSNDSWGQYGAAIKDYAGNADDGIRYAAHGAVASMMLGNGIVETRSYNGRLQPVRIQAGGFLTLWNCYQADDDAICPALTSISANSGNVQGQKVLRGRQSWTLKLTYDAIDRLNSASETGVWQQNYGYDSYGNRWISGSNGLPVDALAPADAAAFAAATNRLAGTDNYDSRGNLKRYNSLSLVYDGESRIISAGDIAPSAKYEYDGEGRRVRAHTCSGVIACVPGPEADTTIYVYDAFGKLAAEYSPKAGSSGTSYFTLDHLGSTRLEMDAEGRQMRCSDYLPFGREIPARLGGRSACFSSGDNTIKFAGKESDVETGLDFSLARYYSGAAGTVHFRRSSECSCVAAIGSKEVRSRNCESSKLEWVRVRA